MTASNIELTELERDALTELVNIGISRAAAGLRKMTDEQVMLSVPSVEVVSRKIAAALIAERESNKLVAVRQDFSGVFAGRALLIFPLAKSMDLVRALTGDEMSIDELAAIEDEALAETGNIILNGCLATMANMLKQSLSMTLPQVVRGDGPHLFELDTQQDDGLVLFLYINFLMRNRDIRGYIAMLMDLPSLASLQALIADFIASVMDDAN